MSYIEEKYNEINHIIKMIKNEHDSQIEKQYEVLNNLKTMIGNNPTAILLEASLQLNQNDKFAAKETLLAGLEKFSFSFPIYFTLLEIAIAEDDRYEEVFRLYAYCYKLVEKETEMETRILAMLKEYTTKITTTENIEMIRNELDKVKEFQEWKDYRLFPLYKDKLSQIRTSICNTRTDEHYFLNMYKSTNIFDIDLYWRILLKYELLKGEYIEGIKTINLQKKDIIAISPVDKDAKMSFEFRDKTIKSFIPLNRYKYYRFDKNEEVSIKNNGELFFSHFRPTEIKNKPKLVLHIFIDGLSYDFMKSNDIEKLIPNTLKFFSGGYINENCHTTGEWTLPSLYSMMSGKYTVNHNLFHSEYTYDVEKHNKIMQEFFYDAGYHTGVIYNNWRATPNYGYYVKANRTVYCPMHERMYCEEMIAETIEHIEAFKDFNNFVRVCIEDLHGVGDDINNSLLGDVLTEPVDMEFKPDDAEKETSVFKAYNPKRIAEYQAEIKKVDFFLEVLYQYLQKNYKDDEFLVVLNSDHGQSYIQESGVLLSYARTNVPLMMRGHNVPNMKSKELISNIDVFSSILHLCDIENDQRVDGRLIKDLGGEQREFTYTESIFAEQSYKAAINDMTHLFFFETIESIGNDGLIPLRNYKTTLLNKATNEEDSLRYPDKVARYLIEIFEHCREWIKIE